MELDYEIIEKAHHRVCECLDIDDNLIPDSDTHRKLRLIYFYKLLSEICGGSQESMTHWMTTENRHLHMVPIESLNKNISVLDNLINYLEYFSSK